MLVRSTARRVLPILRPHGRLVSASSAPQPPSPASVSSPSPTPSPPTASTLTPVPPTRDTLSPSPPTSDPLASVTGAPPRPPPSSSFSPPPFHPEPLPLPDPPAAPVARVRTPVGAFRGGLIGFLLGLTTVGAYGYFRLLDDYHHASVDLLASVDELKRSTEQMASHLSRITALEQAHAELARTAASSRDLLAQRQEYRKLLDSHQVDLLSLRAHVWGLEQDLKNLSKRDTSVRI